MEAVALLPPVKICPSLGIWRWIWTICWIFCITKIHHLILLRWILPFSTCCGESVQTPLVPFLYGVQMMWKNICYLSDSADISPPRSLMHSCLFHAVALWVWNSCELNFLFLGQDIQPKRDLTRFVKWPRYIRLQRQRSILYKRLKVPPAINQFTQALDRQTGKDVPHKVLLTWVIDGICLREEERNQNKI